MQDECAAESAKWEGYVNYVPRCNRSISLQYWLQFCTRQSKITYQPLAKSRNFPFGVQMAQTPTSAWRPKKDSTRASYIVSIKTCATKASSRSGASVPTTELVGGITLLHANYQSTNKAIQWLAHTISSVHPRDALALVPASPDTSPPGLTVDPLSQDNMGRQSSLQHSLTQEKWCSMINRG